LKFSDNKVSVIIPVLNEESGIRKTISSIPQSKIHEIGYDLEIIVIDGNSTDLTRLVATQMGAKVIEESRKGYGQAYKTGLATANGNIIISMDGDGSYPSELIPECIMLLDKKDIDFITVNRFSGMEKGSMSVTHRMGNVILSYIMRRLYAIEIKDSQSGMQIMTRSFVDRISLRSNGYPMCEELKIIAFKHFKSVEVEGKYYRRYGKSKLNTFKHGVLNLMYLFDYRKLLRFSIVVPPKPEANQRFRDYIM
jgi:glycosyltransferase involved in cell wall biosynthesis